MTGVSDGVDLRSAALRPTPGDRADDHANDRNGRRRPLVAELLEGHWYDAATDLLERMLTERLQALTPAEVVAVKGRDVQDGHVRLRFEDEDEKNKEQEVERRYVLLQWPGQ